MFFENRLYGVGDVVPLRVQEGSNQHNIVNKFDKYNVVIFIYI